MKLTLHIWRQKGPGDEGGFVRYDLADVSHHMSFLEMLDVLNQELILKGEEPVHFEHDCREGICGTCGMVIDGQPHGPLTGTTVCQLHMRHFHDGQDIFIEPWRSRAFPVMKDLMVDRAAFDRIIAAGGFMTVRTGSAPEANHTLVPKEAAELSMDAAECIGCGACVAACPNGSASLFVSAKLAHLGLLPQGQPERLRRTQAMLQQAEKEGFGFCSNYGECEAVCPKRISIHFIARANRDFHRAAFTYAGTAGGKKG
jgi:succinate dehydrogenase / fumarate reductase iron-sulfur subunit